MKHVILVGEDLTLENTNTKPEELLIHCRTLGEFSRFAKTLSPTKFITVKTNVDLGCVANCENESDWFNFQECRYYNYLDVFDIFKNKFSVVSAMKVYNIFNRELTANEQSHFNTIYERYGHRKPNLSPKVNTVRTKTINKWEKLRTFFLRISRKLRRID